MGTADAVEGRHESRQAAVADRNLETSQLVLTGCLFGQKVRVLRLLPIELVKASGPAADPLYEFEPDAEDALDALLARYIASRMFECLLSSAASETASRQNAMHAATENAKSLIKDLTVSLNKARQAQITQELTEIISSADALSKKK